MSANLDKVGPTREVISSDGSDSETDFDELEQTDFASCQLVSSGSGSNDTNTAVHAQGDGLTPNTSGKDNPNRNTLNFLQSQKVGC